MKNFMKNYIPKKIKKSIMEKSIDSSFDRFLSIFDLHLWSLSNLFFCSFEQIDYNRFKEI